MRKVPRDQIKAAAAARIESVLRALGFDVPMRGHSIVVCNPVRGEKNPSMQIWIKPGYEGAFKDHGGDAKGDIFDLVAYVKGLDGFEAAADWLAEFLGLAPPAGGGPSRAEREAAARREAQARARREAEQAAADKRARGNAMALWLAAPQKLAGTVAAAYLKTRGIDLKALARAPAALRCHPAHVHRESGQALPCMMALMQDARGFRALHRTWLAPDGSGKADVTPARKIFPGFTGAVIAIARGLSGLPVKEASAQGIADTLILCEGVEDGLSLALADRRARVWAVGALANLAHVALPACAAEVLVAVDNDWGKPQAQALLQRGLDHLASFGKPVVPLRAGIGKDFNDVVRASA